MQIGARVIRQHDLGDGATFGRHTPERETLLRTVQLLESRTRVRESDAAAAGHVPFHART
jgi:hypothetical protein